MPKSRKAKYSVSFAGVVVAAIAMLVSMQPRAATAAEQYFTIPSSRVGPYSAMGTGSSPRRERRSAVIAASFASDSMSAPTKP